MKRLIYLLVLTAVAAMVSCSAASKAAKTDEDRENAELVTLMLEKRMFKMDFTRAYPTAGPSFALTYPYFVSVIRDRVESFLPYFGRAYSIPYGGGEGLRFEAPITNYQMKDGKKGRRIVTFDARTSEDSYQFRIEIYPTGETYLTVNATQKQSMSFSGAMDFDVEFEAIRIID